MRKQYHLRMSEAGPLAWDVDRLIELSHGLPTRDVPLADISELDETFWFDGDAASTCRAVAEHARLIMDANLEHPIILAADGRVMDGMHRVAKALIGGHTYIRAIRFKRTPDPHFVGIEPSQLPYD